MSDVAETHTVESLSRNLIEARLAAAELGYPFIGYLIDMALAEAKASGAHGNGKRVRANGLTPQREAQPASIQS